MKRALARWRELWQGGLPPHSLASFVFALGCVGIATIVRMAIGEISPASAVFAPYYSATLVAALVGGWRAGSFAAAAGAVAAFWFFVPPDWTSHAFDREWIVSYFLFAISSLVIVWAAKSYRDLLWRLRDEEARRELLNRELAHRIRNTLAIVESVISRTLRDQPELRTKLHDRIAALAVTNDLLIQAEWRGAGLRQILAGEFAPYDASRFKLGGEDFACPSELATMLALIFHELTTNAVKYGALSTVRGRVTLCWTRHNGRVAFDWTESGGPPPTPSGREGFGTTLLRKGLRQFGGMVEMRFSPGGLNCCFSLAMPDARPAAAVETAIEQAPCSTALPAGRVHKAAVG